MRYPRIVVKVGTSTLAHPTGLLHRKRVEALVKTLSDIKDTGRELILVTSGAIGVGAGKLGLTSRPKELFKKQACAAVGQSELMKTYDQLFSRYHHTVAQVLLTPHVIDGEKSRRNVVNTFHALFAEQVLPIVNANDTVSTKEIEFGDNDTLSAIVATLVDADFLVLLTDQDGLFEKDPTQFSQAKLIQKVTHIDDRLRKIAGDRKSSLGTGGMITKLAAAEIAAERGIPTLIMNGAVPQRLYTLLDGGFPGTLFCLAG